MQNIINTKFTVEVWNVLFIAALNGAGNRVRTRDTKLGNYTLAFLLKRIISGISALKRQKRKTSTEVELSLWNQNLALSG
jgi:hypothetical protein